MIEFHSLYYFCFFIALNILFIFVNFVSSVYKAPDQTISDLLLHLTLSALQI